LEIKGCHFLITKQTVLRSYLANIDSICIKCGAAFCFFDSGQYSRIFFLQFARGTTGGEKTPQIRAFPHHRFKNVISRVLEVIMNRCAARGTPDRSFQSMQIQAIAAAEST
jgi:hypothetical protein